METSSEAIFLLETVSVTALSDQGFSFTRRQEELPPDALGL